MEKQKKKKNEALFLCVKGKPSGYNRIQLKSWKADKIATNKLENWNKKRKGQAKKRMEESWNPKSPHSQFVLRSKKCLCRSIRNPLVAKEFKA